MDIFSKAQYLQRVTNAKVDLTTVNATVLYTAPSGDDFDFVVVDSILVSEDGAQATTITLTLTNGASVYSLYSLHPVAAQATSELITNGLVLQAGEILTVTAAHANKLHVVASLIEYAKGD